MQELTINDLFDFTFDNPNNEHRIIDLGIIEVGLAEKIKNATEIDVKGFVISIDNYGIKHAFERHGNNDIENRRGQKAIEKRDFEQFLFILNNAETIRYDFRGEHGKPTLKESLVFSKTLDYQYFIALEIRKVTKKPIA
jgi:hypothetical protein